MKQMRWIRSCLLVSLLTLPAALGQHSQAICNISSLSWSFNSLGQSPCDVAGNLQSSCNPSVVVTPLGGPTLSYAPPPSIPPSQCDCSTVTYSLLMVCSACQGGSLIPWSFYAANCSAKASPDGQYPLAIPPGTAIPKWAYQSVIASGQFNISLANSVGDLPENGTSTSSSSSSLATSSTSTSSSPSPSQTNDPAHKNNAGAIAGGVIGGLAILAINAILLTLCLRARRRRKYVSSQEEGSPQQVCYLSDTDGLVSPFPQATTATTTSQGPTSSEYTTSSTHQSPGGGGYLRDDRPNTPSTCPPPYMSALAMGERNIASNNDENALSPSSTRKGALSPRNG